MGIVAREWVGERAASGWTEWRPWVGRWGRWPRAAAERVGRWRPCVGRPLATVRGELVGTVGGSGTFSATRVASWTRHVATACAKGSAKTNTYSPIYFYYDYDDYDHYYDYNDHSDYYYCYYF